MDWQQAQIHPAAAISTLRNDDRRHKKTRRHNKELSRLTDRFS
jgi:hypothetical protein